MKEENINNPDIFNEDGRGEEFINKQSKKEVKGKKKKVEFSKIMCVLAVIIFTIVGLYSICEYYILVKLAIEMGSSTLPDASLPITSITSILAAVLSYCLYQFGLKNSRNKFGIDSEGQPFKDAIINYSSIEEEEENNNDNIG